MTKKEKILKVVQEFTFLDDTFMRVVFNNEKTVGLLIRTILQNDELQVKEINTQVDYKNLRGKSAILDIVATDEKGDIYNIEVQRDSKGASPKRARYHSSLLDVNISNANEDIEKLPRTYVIFITQKDVLKGNKQIYHIKRIIQETNEEFKDETQIIYVNASKSEDSDIGKLMHDFRCKDPEEMYYEDLSQVAKYYKKTEKGVTNMCKLVEDLFEDLIEEEKQEWIQKGEALGLSKGRMEGEAQGIIKGEAQGIIKGLVIAYRDDFDIKKDEAITKLSKKFGLTNSEATEYVNKYYM